MHYPTKLNYDDMAVLLDIHEDLMTWNTDESLVLQKLCEKLQSAFNSCLIWGGSIDEDAQLIIKGAAGEGSERIRGAILNDVKSSDYRPIRECIETLLPITVQNGLIEFHSQVFETLPPDIRTARFDLYPLTSESQCVGLLGISAKSYKNRNQYPNTLFQLTAQHAGFALGMLKTFVAKDKAQNNLKLAAAVFDSSLEGIFITDTNGTILAANDAVTRITGYAPSELIGQNPRMLKSDRHGKDFYVALWAAVSSQNQWEGEIWNKRKNGEIFPEWLSISAIKNEYGQVENYIGIFIDISKQKEAENRLTYLAYHDKLTGLPNRDLFYDRLNTAILQAKRHQVEIAVLFIDLDHFKFINDTFGHTSGDIVLQQVAARLTMCLRETDTLARMGGDEFTVVLQDFDNRGDVETTAQRILKSLSAPLILENQELYISASIGISFFPEDGGNPALLMKHADTAMYSAKNSGRKCLHFFRSSMEGYSLKRIEMEQQLRQGLERNEFKLYYQPQINLENGRIIGAEALIRWQHPEKGLLPPSQFIAIAEDTGLIEPIGEWVLREAWSQRQGWHRSGWEDFRIAVNLSAHQFDRISLVKTVADVLGESDIDPAILELELTETVAMQDVGKTLNILNELKKFGVQLSIDDFGTGYSSLMYLRQFPIDRLKIDRTFVANIAHNPNEAAIVVAIIAMAHSMGLEVIAEGVETKGQLSFLKMHGCNEAQGYLMGKPMSGPALFSRLQQEAR